jgi:hypothetical protein
MWQNACRGKEGDGIYYQGRNNHWLWFHLGLHY